MVGLTEIGRSQLMSKKKYTFFQMLIANYMFPFAWWNGDGDFIESRLFYVTIMTKHNGRDCFSFRNHSKTTHRSRFQIIT